MKTMKTIIVKELNIEVDAELTNQGNKWLNYKIPDGKRILTFSEIAYLYENEKYRKILGLDKTDEFFKHPSNDKSIGNFYSGLFSLDGHSRFLAFDWNVDIPGNALRGVRFVRDIKKK